MGAVSFANRTFLIVDDHNFSRITVLRLLKNMGDPQTYSATNGVEALALLEERSYTIDCVIADFNMPVMHGLLLLKNIRTGHNNIRRNMPVLMLTGHGDSALVELAIQMDVSSFVLKPVTKQTLTDRLVRIFKTCDPKDMSYVKDSSVYERMDVDTRIRSILEQNAATQIEDSSIVKEEKKPKDDGTTDFVNVSDLTPGAVLARPVFNKDGSQVFLREGSVLNEKQIDMLRDLVDMTMIDPVVAIARS